MAWVCIKGAISGCIIGGVVSGIVSAIQGNSFWDGLVEGAVYGLINGYTSAAILYGIQQGVTAAVKAANKAKACKSACFIAGTLVLTALGYKAIEEIEAGDKVLAYNEDTGEQAYKLVVRLFRNETKEWYHVFAEGEEIVCTGGHPFYVVGIGFVEARNLKTSDKLLLSSGKEVIIEKVEVNQLAEAETTYNFEVADFHTYYVTEKAVLVHNKCRTTQRKKYWKQRAESPDALELYGKDNITLMRQGKAPIVKGEKIILHHVEGIANNFNYIVEMTQSNHILFHKTYGYKNFISVLDTNIPIFYGG